MWIWILIRGFDSIIFGVNECCPNLNLLPKETGLHTHTHRNTHTHTHTHTHILTGGYLSHIYLSHSMSHLCRYKSHLSNTILMSPMDATRRIQNLSLSSRTTCRTLNNRRKRRIEFCTQVTCRVNCPSQLFVSVMKIALIDATRRIRERP